MLLENQLLCSNYLFSITVIMQFYSKTPIESVCQSSFPALPHEQYHPAYVHQLEKEMQDYAFSYFLWPKQDLHSHNSIYTNVRKYHRHLYLSPKGMCIEYERPIVDNSSTIGLTFYQLCINQFLLNDFSSIVHLLFQRCSYTFLQLHISFISRCHSFQKSTLISIAFLNVISF